MVIKKTSKTAKKTTPASAKTKKKKVTDSIQDMLDFVVKKLDSGKAEALTVLNIKGKSSLADYLVLATGTSSRHVMALIHNLAEDLKKKGIKPVSDGMHGDGSWVVLDLGDIIVHVLNPEARLHFSLEEIWS